MNEFSIFVNQRKLTPERIQLEEGKLNKFLKQLLYEEEVENTKGKSFKKSTNTNSIVPLNESQIDSFKILRTNRK